MLQLGSIHIKPVSRCAWNPARAHNYHDTPTVQDSGYSTTHFHLIEAPSDSIEPRDCRRDSQQCAEVLRYYASKLQDPI